MINTKIEIDGIKYHLGVGFLSELIKGTGKSLVELGQEDEMVLLPILMYYSRLYACKREGLAADFTEYDIYDYIDGKGGITGTVIAEFRDAYIISMQQDVPQQEKKKADPKRKQTS